MKDKNLEVPPRDTSLDKMFDLLLEAAREYQKKRPEEARKLIEWARKREEEESQDSK